MYFWHHGPLGSEEPWPTWCSFVFIVRPEQPKGPLVFHCDAIVWVYKQIGRKGRCSAPQKVTLSVPPCSNTSILYLSRAKLLHFKDVPWSHLTLPNTCLHQLVSTNVFSVIAFLVLIYSRGKVAKAEWHWLCSCVLWHQTPQQAPQFMHTGWCWHAQQKQWQQQMPFQLAPWAKPNSLPGQQDHFSAAPCPLLLAPLSCAVKMFPLLKFSLLSW